MIIAFVISLFLLVAFACAIVVSHRTDPLDIVDLPPIIGRVFRAWAWGAGEVLEIRDDGVCIMHHGDGNWMYASSWTHIDAALECVEAGVWEEVTV